MTPQVVFILALSGVTLIALYASGALFVAVSFLMHPIRFVRDARDSRKRQRESAMEVAIHFLAFGYSGKNVESMIRCMYPYEARKFRWYVKTALRLDYEDDTVRL